MPEPSTFATAWPSSSIPVEKFDLILLFPFALRTDEVTRPDDKRGTERLRSWLSQIASAKDTQHPAAGSVWKELDGPYPDANDEKNRLQQYAEWVFYHPFIRSFLYESKNDRQDSQKGNGNGEGKSMRILERKDLQGAKLLASWWDQGDMKSVGTTLPVRNVHLFLFDTGIGVLSVELLGDDCKLTLKGVLDLQDKIRRLYCPYFDPKDFGSTIAGHCLQKLELVDAKSQVLSSNTFGEHRTNSATSDPERAAFLRQLAQVNDHLEPDVADVWRELLWPLRPRELLPRKNAPRPKSIQDENQCGLRFEQILDERMPLISYIAVPDPRLISEGDWMRLATVDDSGDSERYPYSPSFAAEQGLKPFAYDRFWSASWAKPAQGKFQQTRWLCCGYGFTAVGSSRDTDFFANEVTGARAHVRYHYFKLMLIAQFHRASLLRFKSQLADAVENLQQSKAPGGALDEFAKRLQRIQLDLLAFRNMYWFTEVSNQVQPQELFDLMSKHLRTRELFSQVFEESEKAASIVSGHRERLQNERTARLGVLAALFLLVSPVVGAIYTTEEIQPIWRAIGAFAAASTAVVLGLIFSKFITAIIDRITHRWWGKAVAILAVAAGLFWAWMMIDERSKISDKPTIANPLPVEVIVVPKG